MSHIKFSKHTFLNIIEDMLIERLSNRNDAWITIDIKPNHTLTKWIEQYVTMWNDENGSTQMGYNENKDCYDIYIDTSLVYPDIEKDVTDETIIMKEDDIQNLYYKDGEYKDNFEVVDN